MEPVLGGEPGAPGRGGQVGQVTEQVNLADESRTVFGYGEEGGST